MIWPRGIKFNETGRFSDLIKTHVHMYTISYCQYANTGNSVYSHVRISQQARNFLAC